MRRCLRRNQPGPYQVQAAINAVHSDAPAAAATDWAQVVALYDQLLSLDPSAVVALHRAVAVAEVEGPDAALTLVGDLDLGGYYLFHAIRADLLRRLGRGPRRRWRTRRRSPAPTTRPSATSCAAAVRRSLEYDGGVASRRCLRPLPGAVAFRRRDRASGDGRLAGGCQLPRLRPPSTRMRWPVTKPASAAARKLTAWAMSAGVPIRPAGTEAR